MTIRVPSGMARPRTRALLACILLLPAVLLGGQLTQDGRAALVRPGGVGQTTSLAGTYLIGSAQPYPFNTLTNAVNQLGAVGVSDSVTFLLEDPLYASPQELFPIVIPVIPGAGPASPVTIRPAPGVTTTMTGNVAGGLVRLNGTDDLTIDGSDNGTTSRRLSIVNTSPSSATAVIWLSSAGAGSGCVRNAIRNCIMACGADQAASSAETFGILAGGSAVSVASDGLDHDNNEFSGNLITRCRWGILLRGAATDLNQGNRIERNVVGPAAFGGDQIGRGGIIVLYQDHATIERNEVRMVGRRLSDAASGLDHLGIGIGGFSWPPTTPATVTASQVTRNLVHDVVDEKTFSAIGILVNGGGAPGQNVVANNMLFNILANGTAGDQAIGIGVGTSAGDLIACNSVSMTGDLDPAGTLAASQSAAGLLVRPGGASNLTLLDNILHVALTSNSMTLSHYAIVVPGASYAWGAGGSDHNDLFADPVAPQSILGGLGTATPYTPIPGLPTWQTSFTPNQDAGSVNVLPPFLGPGDLHLQPNAPSAVRGGGIPVPGVPMDYDGQARDPLAPDIGADEAAALSRAEAIALVTDNVIVGHPDASQLVGFLYNRVAPDSLLSPGSVVADIDSNFVVTVAEPSYLFWLDDHPTAIWYHATTFVLVGACSGSLTVHSGQSWPVLDNVEIDRFPVEGNDSAERFVGSYPTGPDIPFVYTSAPGGSTTSWAIVFFGNVREQKEKKAHEEDLKRARDILNKAPMGPRVAEGNIKSITGPQYCGTSKQAFCDTLEALTGCDKVFIYYIGHGAASGYMGMRRADGKSEKFTFEELAEKLKAKGIKEVCLILDCCYSGQALKALEAAGLKGSVITAAGPNNEGHWTYGVGWNLTVALQECINDPFADLDHDGHISLIEALAWARTRNPRLVTDGATGDILGDGRKPVKFPPPVCTNLGQANDGEGNTICFLTKEHSYTIGDSTVSRKSLYVYNLSGSAHTGVKEYRVQMTCYDKNGQATTRKLDRIALEKKGDPKGKDRLCLFDIDPKWVTYKFDRVNAAPAGRVSPKSVPPFRTLTDRTYRSRPYRRGEFLFQELPATGSPGDQFTAFVESVPGWDVSIDPPLFTWSAAMDTEWVMVRATAPDTATQGQEFFATIINTTDADTADWVIRALVSDSLAAPVAGGQSFVRLDLRTGAGLNVTTGQASFVQSRLELLAPAPLAVGPGGALSFHESLVYPDSGVSYTFEALGGLDWDGSGLFAPATGLRLNGAHGLMSLGSVVGSEEDGLVAIGNLTGLEVHQFVVERSARDGVRFDASSGAVFRGLRVLDSGRYDVTLVNGAQATLVDAGFSDAKVSVQAGATLTRAWTSPFIFETSAGAGVAGVIVQVHDALGALVARDTTDSRGLTDIFDLVQYQQAGVLRTSHTPHLVTASWGASDTTFSYLADASRVVEVTLGGTVSGGEPGGSPPRFLLRQNTPNPFAAATILHYELAQDARVTLEILSVDGRLIQSLVDEHQSAGPHDLLWDPGDRPAGIYWARLFAGGSVTTRKLVRVGGRP